MLLVSIRPKSVVCAYKPFPTILHKVRRKKVHKNWFISFRILLVSMALHNLLKEMHCFSITSYQNYILYMYSFLKQNSLTKPIFPQISVNKIFPIFSRFATFCQNLFLLLTIISQTYLYHVYPM